MGPGRGKAGRFARQTFGKIFKVNSRPRNHLGRCKRSTGRSKAEGPGKSAAVRHPLRRQRHFRPSAPHAAVSYASRGILRTSRSSARGLCASFARLWTARWPRASPRGSEASCDLSLLGLDFIAYSGRTPPRPLGSLLKRCACKIPRDNRESAW